MNIDDQDKEMAAGFGAALALTEEAVSESQEQRTQRIWDETLAHFARESGVVGFVADANRQDVREEFARRLLAEHQKQAPVAQIVFDERWIDNKLVEKRRPQIFPLGVDLMQFEQGTKLYAAPVAKVQDVLQRLIDAAEVSLTTPGMITGRLGLRQAIDAAMLTKEWR